MHFFHFGGKSEEELSNLRISEKSKIWHKFSEHKHYTGIPKESPIAEGDVYKKGKLFKKHLILKLFPDAMIFFKFNAESSQNNHPYAIIFFEFDLKIQWHFIQEKTSKKNEFNNRLNSFKLIKFTHSIEFKCDSQEFLSLIRQYTALLLFRLDFAEDFTIIKAIGKGTSATVFLCEDHHSDQRFAVKACKKKELFTQTNWKEVLINEINCLKALNHPNIIKLHSIYETDKFFSLVFDLLEGGNLAHYLEKNPRGLNDEHCFHLMKSLLSGLSYMHGKNFMHRDLKPENILFKKKNSFIDENNLCIADFGLATNQNVAKYLFFRCGTPGYIAPEVLQITDPKTKYSEKCDVFSIGAIMYYCLSGVKLFIGKDSHSIVNLNRKANVDYSLLKKKNVGEEAIDLLKKMLLKDSKGRISASEALLHPYFDENRLKISIEEEEFSSKVNQFDSHLEVNSLAYLENFDFSCKNYTILTQKKELKKKESFNLIENENDEIYSLFVKDAVMNGFVDTVNNISLQELILLKSFPGSTNSLKLNLENHKVSSTKD